MSWLGDAWDSVTDAAEDVCEGVASAAETVGDAVEGAVDAVADAVEDGVDAAVDAIEGAVDSAVTWINEHGGAVLGGIANILGGVVNGFLDGIKSLVHDVVNIFKDAGFIVGSILRLDFGAVIQGIVNLFIDLVDLLIDFWVRWFFLGFLIGGIVEQFKREALRDFVKDLLKEQFAQNPALLERIKNKIGIDGAGWGLPMTGNHHVFMLDSANTPLWQWHQDGTLDLYALAGVLSFDSFQVERPRTWVRVVGEDGQDNFFPVTRWVIKEYLESKGKKRRLRVYAMDRQAVAERLDVAVNKCHKLGVQLSWNQSTAFYSGMFPVQEINAKEEYRFALARQGGFVIDHGLRTGDRSEECVLLGLGAFQLEPSRFGQTAGRHLEEGDRATPCVTPGRDDHCCVTITTQRNTAGSSVIHRDFWPAYVFRYVLVHEIGHYLGLCHYGHDGVQNIMYSAAEEANLSMWDLGLFTFYYQSEPEFSLSDGKNAWRFIVNQLPCCLDDTLTCGVP